MCQWNTAPWEKGKCYWHIYSLHYRKSKRDMTALDRFLNKEKWHSQVIGMFATFRENWLSPERQMPSHSSFMLLLKKRLSYPYRYKTQLNFVLYLHSVLFINVTLRLESRSLYFLQPSYLQRYADTAAGKGAPWYICFDFVDGTIARICRPVLNERGVYSHHTKVHGLKF